MSEFIIKKATKKAKKLRLGLSAASGFGKTYGALLTAKGLCGGDLSKVCVIDTEKDSATLYADLGGYSTLQLSAPYSPERYINAITAAEQAGFSVIIIDSITHEWDGPGGCLEIHASLGGKYQDWSKVTPRHDAFVNKILNSSCHIITTVRRKQDYEMSSVNGRMSVQKVGTKEVQRDGFEYELDINFEVTNENHLVKASKDRTRLFANQPEFIITEETGKKILDWCNQGTSSIDDALASIRAANDIGTLTSIYKTYEGELKDNKDFMDALKARKAKLEEATTLV
jgi:hypothetical protein